MKRTINILSLVGAVVGLTFACQTLATPTFKVEHFSANKLHKSQINVNNQFSSVITATIQVSGQEQSFDIPQGQNAVLFNDQVLIPQSTFQISAAGKVLLPNKVVYNHSQINVKGTPDHYTVTITPLTSKK